MSTLPKAERQDIRRETGDRMIGWGYLGRDAVPTLPMTLGSIFNSALHSALDAVIDSALRSALPMRQRRGIDQLRPGLA